MTLNIGTLLTAPIRPRDSNDVYPMVESTYLKGSMRSVANITARNAIPAARREAGMLVKTQADGKTWELGVDLTTWTEWLPSGVIARLQTFSNKAAFNTALSSLVNGRYIVDADESVPGSPPTEYNVSSGVATRVFIGVVTRTSSEIASITPLLGQEIINSDLRISVIGDGVTVGGLTGGGFIQTGSGSSQRSMLNKAQEVVTPEDKGAIGDGVTSDNTAFTSLVTLGKGVKLKSGASYKLSTPVNIPANVTYSGDGSIVSSASTALNLADGAQVSGMNIVSSAGPAVRPQTSSRAVVRDSTITGAAGVYLNLDGTSASITGNKIDVTAYGVLTNTPGNNLGRVIVSASDIKSSTGDAMEFNAPGGKIHQDIVVSGVIGETVNGGPSAGFVAGFAAAKNAVVSGLVVPGSKQEVLHIEDAQENLVFVGVAARECQQEGIWWAQNVAQTGRGITAVGGAYKAATGSSSAGAQAVWDANSSVPACLVAMQRFNGFDRGLDVGTKTIVAPWNIVENSTTAAVQVSGGGDILGQTYVVGAATLIRAANKGKFRVGKISSDTQPTALVNLTSMASHAPGFILEGVAFPINNLIVPAAGSLAVTLFPLPTRIFGRASILLDTSVGGHVYYSATLKFDGTTLTVSDIVSETYGIGTINSITATGGNLVINLANASGASITDTLKFDFNGDLYFAPP